MSYEYLLCSVDDRGLATMKLNRPQKLNAMNFKMQGEIRGAIQKFGQDPQVKIILVTGEGRMFSSGVDVQEVAQLKEIKETAFPPRAGGLDLLMKECDKITIAAVNGPAIGMGCDLTLTCDFRIASDKAVFWQAYARLMPPSAGTWYLPRLVGLQKAMEMLLLGEPVEAPEAARIGLVYKTVPHEELMREAERLIQKLLSFSPAVLHHTKHSILKGLEQDFATAMEHIRYTRAVCAHLGIIEEAARAIMEKRAPDWKY